MRRDPDKARAWQRRSKRINPVSKKRRATCARRHRVVQAVFERDGGCVMRVGGPKWTRDAPECRGWWDGHEPLRRSQGGDPLDPDQVLTLCRAHHDYVHAHVAWAKSVGLLVVPGRGAHPPSAAPAGDVSEEAA